MADRTRELLTELVKLRAAWESRVVEVRTSDLTTTLFLNFGEIAAVKASKPGEPIGRMLVRKGLISREHYLEVLERIGEVLNTGARVAFGEVAVGLGYTKAEDVSACLTEQVRALGMRVFQGVDPEWTVLPMPENRDPSRDLTMRVEAVFLDAIRMLDEKRKGALGLDAARPLALRPVWTPQEIDVRLELTGEEADFVRVALAGDKTVEELLASSVSASVDPAAILTALIATEAAESRNTVTAERHDKPEPRKAPPPLPAWATVDATKAKGAAETAVRARRSQAPPRMGSSPLEQMLKAEQTFERGREALVRGDVKMALGEFESALALNPASVEYQLFVMWTRHRLSGAAITDATRTELEARAREALRENPQFAIAHFVLSVVHDASGRVEEARAELARARDLDRELFHSAHVTPPAAAKPASPAAAPAAAAVARGAAPATPARPASGMGGRIALAIVVVAVGVIGVIAYQATRPATVEPAASSSAAPPPGMIAAPADAGTDAGAPRDAGADSGSRAVARPIDPTRGVVHLPKSAQGHRVFIDGKADTGSESDHLLLPCGHHEIQIGSHGAARPIDVPCGGEIDLH